MIRPFDLRDIGLVRELEGQGTPLFVEAALTGHTAPLRGALVAYFGLSRRGGTPTFVLRERADGGSRQAFAQLRHYWGAERARLTYIAPSPTPEDIASAGWGQLLESLVAAAGERGAQSLVAEAPEGGEEVTWLRKAGFAVYARQDVWRLARPRPGLAASNGRSTLRPRHPQDAWGVHLLYANTAPRLLQLAEPPPGEYSGGWRRGYVMGDQGGEIVAYVEIRQGPRGVWVKALLHPDADERAGEVITGVLALLEGRPERPVYWGVWRYQDWLRGPLADAGFEPWTSQAIMVKQIVARVEQPEPALLPALEKRPEITTPVSGQRSALSHPRPVLRSELHPPKVG